MIAASVALVLVEPVSAIMLAIIILRTHHRHWMPWPLRVIFACLAACLLMHAAATAEAAFHMQPLRSWWCSALVVSFNAAIWATYFFMRAHARAVLLKADGDTI